MTANPVRYGQHQRILPGTPCEVCGADSGRSVMDHCHMHGWTRGVLCVRCNHGMASIDSRRVPGLTVKHWEPDIVGLLGHAAKCPDCPEVVRADLDMTDNRAPVRTFRAEQGVINDADEALRALAVERRVVITIAPRTSRSAAIVAFLRALGR